MTKKKKGAGKPPPDPASSPPVEVEVDYATLRTSDEETDTVAATNAEREDPSSPRVDLEPSPRSSSSSSSSSEERSSSAGHPLVALAPSELAVLLWEEDTKENIRATRENRTPAPLSAGPAEVAVTIRCCQAAQVHEAAIVSELSSVLPVTTTAVANSLSSSTSAADTSVQAPLPFTVDHNISTIYASASRAAVHRTEGKQPSSVTPSETQLPSATQTNPSLDSSNTRPSLVDVAAVAVTAADLRARDTQPFPCDGDMVALEHVALLGEGHSLTFIQQLVTG